MSEEARGRGRRRLAAILFAGLSQLFPGDEKESFAGLIAFAADVVGPKVAEYGGRIVSVRSEAVLVEFESVVEAVRCAASLREAATQRNQELLDEQRIAMRIGINLGDIIAEGDDVFGDGVNIAARIEALAEPGSVFVSETVYYHIVDKVDFQFEDLGPQSLKNIRRPIRVYRMGGEIFRELAEPGGVEPFIAKGSPRLDDRRLDPTENWHPNWHRTT